MTSAKIKRTMRRFSIGYHGKLLFIVFGLFIGLVSLIYSNNLVSQLREKEKREVRLWAEAIHYTVLTNDQYDLQRQATLINRVVNEPVHDIPIIVCDDNLRVLRYRLVDPSVLADVTKLRNRLESMQAGGRDPIAFETSQGAVYRVFYGESSLLVALRYYPLAQITVFALFIGFAFIAFRSSKHSEQNRVWIGMAKETAHQLGTPTTSLLGWMEYLRNQPINQEAVDEMSKDLTRLLKVTDRFSKIGATTNLVPRNIQELVKGVVAYFQTRIPKNVSLNFTQFTNTPLQGLINDALFEWVIENLLKNALDALQGKGSITVRVSLKDNRWICIDVKDTGKGIPKSNFKRIFNPGFTTKTRGWGLGLSLSKRIVEEYHHGKIFVQESEIDKGSTMRIMIKKL